MTVYSAIVNSEIDADSPGTTGLFTKLRDNLLAIQEGDATAPKIKPSSALDDAITTDSYQAIGASSYYTPPAGVYNITALHANAGRLQLYVSSVWRLGLTSVSGAVMFDGVNMRILNAVASTQYLVWQRFDG
jgi:hypothetical protein